MTEGPAAPMPDDAGTGNGRSLRDLARDPRRSATALIAIAALVALAVWLVVESVSDDGGGSTATTSQSTDPVAVSAGGLATLAQATGRLIYWAGARNGVMYELRQSGGGEVYVRYLPRGVRVGDPRALLTIATYPVENAYDVTSKIQGSGVEAIPLEGGGIAVVSTDRPTSAYVAFPGVDYQIEIYDPDPKVVRSLATNRAVQPVPAPALSAEARGPEIVTQADLASLSKELGHPVYWAGPKGSMEYELTVTADGNVFIRYLEPGTEAGFEPPALTVGTYQLVDAYNITNDASDGGPVQQVPGGGVSVKGKANNVYVAYPGEDLQIEVYSPKSGEAARLVRQGDIVPVG